MKSISDEKVDNLINKISKDNGSIEEEYKLNEDSKESGEIKRNI